MATSSTTQGKIIFWSDHHYKWHSAILGPSPTLQRARRRAFAESPLQYQNRQAWFTRAVSTRPRSGPHIEMREMKPDNSRAEIIGGGHKGGDGNKEYKLMRVSPGQK